MVVKNPSINKLKLVLYHFTIIYNLSSTQLMHFNKDYFEAEKDCFEANFASSD